MGWWACLAATIGAVILARRARWSLFQTLVSAALTAGAALSLRWAIIETLSPAYPELRPALVGPWTAAAVAATVLGWLVRDHYGKPSV